MLALFAVNSALQKQPEVAQMALETGNSYNNVI